PADNVQSISEAIEKILDDFIQEEQNGDRRAMTEKMTEKNSGSLPTVGDAVQKLIALAKGAKDAEEAGAKNKTCC
ncbi:MAG: hypothetical protein D3925_19715, partial [Candidatus Electrothrix sp. AR5]|nr:hypothetical protein [Candidatus Electrothrix sp. AR5]